VLLAYSYSIAARRPDADGLHFHLFWAGELVFLVPAFLHLLDRRTSTRSRLVIVVATALFDAVPKYLRDPSFPIFHDELFHSRQAEAVLTSGASFQSTPIIGIIKFFPGLHTLAASLAAQWRATRTRTAKAVANIPRSGDIHLGERAEDKG
jgi:hypothetical protein